MVISIGELQKNISILSNLKEPILVKDKRKNKIVAKIEPVGEDGELFEKLFSLGKKESVKKESFEEAYGEYLKEKYGTR